MFVCCRFLKHTSTSWKLSFSYIWYIVILGLLFLGWILRKFPVGLKSSRGSVQHVNKFYSALLVDVPILFLAIYAYVILLIALQWKKHPTVSTVFRIIAAKKEIINKTGSLMANNNWALMIKMSKFDGVGKTLSVV